MTFQSHDQPLPRRDADWTFCHIRGSATVAGKMVQGAVVERNEVTGQCRFFEVPVRKIATPDGSLIHAASWLIAQEDFVPHQAD